MEPRSSVGHMSPSSRKSIKRGDLALEKHLLIGREQLAFPGKGQTKAAKEGRAREGTAYQYCRRQRCRSSVVKQRERLKEKCLARAKMHERWRSKMFAPILQLSGE